MATDKFIIKINLNLAICTIGTDELYNNNNSNMDNNIL